MTDLAQRLRELAKLRDSASCDKAELFDFYNDHWDELSRIAHEGRELGRAEGTEEAARIVACSAALYWYSTAKREEVVAAIRSLSTPPAPGAKGGDGG